MQKVEGSSPFIRSSENRPRPTRVRAGASGSRPGAAGERAPFEEVVRYLFSFTVVFGFLLA